MGNIKVSATAASNIHAISDRHADPAAARAVVQPMLAHFVAGAMHDTGIIRLHRRRSRILPGMAWTAVRSIHRPAGGLISWRTSVNRLDRKARPSNQAVRPRADLDHSTLLAGMAPAPGLMALLDPAGRLAELARPTGVPGLQPPAGRAALRRLDACAHVDLLYNNAPSIGVPS